MHISLIRQRYNPYGGAERFVSRALAALESQNLKVSLVARSWEPINKIEFIKCDPFYIGRLWRDWGFSRSACRQVNQLQADLVQSHERMSCCDIYRAGDGVHKVWLQQKYKKQPEWKRYLINISPYHAYVKAMEKRLFEQKRLKAVICNSQMVKNEIVENFVIDENKIHVIYSGVDISHFHPRIKQQKESIKQQWRLPSNAVIFLFLGSGFERKGLLQVLQAFKTLPQNSFLLIVGYDKHERNYAIESSRLEIKSRVKFLGSQKDVIPCYAVADAFVLPTLYDPFPNTVLEALACGLPVITSTKSGAAEIISSAQQGFVCDAFDVNKLEEFMGVLCDKQIREEMGHKARVLAENYSMKKMTHHLITLYKKIIQEV